VIVNTSNANFVITPNFTLPAGTNRYVLFMLAFAGVGVGFPNSVDIAGTAATMITEVRANEAAQIWGANIPDSTAAGNYTITFDGTCSARKFIAVFTGVSRDPVVDSAAFRNGSSSSDGILSRLIALAVDGCTTSFLQTRQRPRGQTRPSFTTRPAAA